MLSGEYRKQGQTFWKALQPMHICWPAAPYQPLCYLCCFPCRLYLSLASRLLPAASARLFGVLSAAHTAHAYACFLAAHR